MCRTVERGEGSEFFWTLWKGGSEIFSVSERGGQQFFSWPLQKFADPPHPILNEHSLILQARFVYPFICMCVCWIMCTCPCLDIGMQCMYVYIWAYLCVCVGICMHLASLVQGMASRRAVPSHSLNWLRPRTRALLYYIYLSIIVIILDSNCYTLCYYEVYYIYLCFILCKWMVSYQYTYSEFLTCRWHLDMCKFLLSYGK